MKKFFRWIGILIGFFVLLAMLIALSVLTFVSPNRFKPLLIEVIQQSTGRQVIMDGDISWTLFPAFGLKIEHVALKNPPGFDQGIFAEIKSATFSLKWIPLWHKEIASYGITVDGLKVHLIKNAQGQVNWKVAGPATPDEATSSDVSHDSRGTASTAVNISNFHITHAELTWKDEQQRKSMGVYDLNFHAKQISLLKPFPIDANFVWMDDESKVKHAIKMTADTSMDVEAKIFSFRKMQIQDHISKDKKRYRLDLSADLLADLDKEMLQGENLTLQSEKLSLKGKLNVAQLFSGPMLSGHMQLSPIDMKAWLKNAGWDVASLQAMEDVQGHFEFIPVKNDIVMQGKLNLNKLVINHINFSNVVLPLRYQHHVLSLGSFQSGFYSGELTGKMTADFNSAMPRFDLSLALQHMDTALFMQDVSPGQKLTLAGDGNLELTLSTMGTDKTTLLRHLEGQGKIHMAGGELRGVDINYMIASATAIARHQASTSSNTNKTKFDQFNASFTIHQGVVSSRDLQMHSTEFNTAGQGEMDLSSQRINYHLQILLTQTSLDNKKQALNLYGLPIPILISGDLSHPSIQLDQEALSKALATQQIEKVRTQIQEKVEKGKIPEKAGKFLQQLLGH